MNYIKHLSGFFNKVSADDRLNPTHVSLYVSLFQFWNACRFHNPISISRQEAMNVSKISSKVTYHKCIRELHQFGYLRYEPSYNPFKGSLVYLFDFQTGTELVNKVNQSKTETSTVLVANSYRTKNKTGTVQALIPYINNTNNSKQQTEVNELFKPKSDEKINNQKLGNKKLENSKRKKVAPKKENNVSISSGRGIEGEGTRPKNWPLLEIVKNYFETKSWPTKEADKFYNHYESNGWLVGGKTPMANWMASAENWMINSVKFANDKKTGNSVKPGGLAASTDKNYSEPL